MMKATEVEIAQAIEEQEFWQKYADIFSWSLVGWTGKRSATFNREDGSSLSIGHYGEIRVEEIDRLLTQLPQKK